MSIDAGTTGITVLLVDEQGNIAKKAYSEFPQYFPRPGWVEHDPEEIWAATIQVIGEALSESDIEIAAIGITNQRETTILWDKATLAPVHNAIVWQCRRSAGICDELIENGFEETIRRKTGLVVDAYFSGTKLTWLFREHPDLLKRAEAGELSFGTVDAWLIAKLTGGSEHATDHSNASRTLLYNLGTGDWDEELLEIMKVPSAVLPEIVGSSGRVAMPGVGPFAGRPVPIAGIAGDQQSALFGQACFQEGMSKNTYGTGSFVLTSTGSSHDISRHQMLTTVAWKIEDRLTYALEGAIFVTGAAVQWLRDGLGIIQEAAEIGPLAESVPDTGGVYFVPALTGLGAPHWDPDARGNISGLTRGTTRAHIARATIEAMAYQTKDVVDAMALDSGVEPKELRVDGGASVMDSLCQFQADMLGIPVSRSKVSETTAMGAAYLAGLAEGVWGSTSDIASLWKLDQTFEPKMDEGKRQDLLEGWRQALRRTAAQI